MKFDLFVSDFDGTLGMHPGVISEENLSAIKEYTDKGGKFAICTGRMTPFIQKICKKYQLEGVLISYQGASITDIETGDYLFRGGLDYSLAIDVAERLKKENLETVLHLDNKMYYEKRSEYTDFYESSNLTKGTLIKSIPELIEKDKGIVSKLIVFCEDEKMLDIAERYKKIYGDKLTYNSANSYLFEIINSAYSKGFAVKYLADYYKIPYNKVIAVGDSTNDIDFMTGEWHGVCVGDGKEELKKMAAEVTVPYDQHPIAHLLKKYCL